MLGQDPRTHCWVQQQQDLGGGQKVRLRGLILFLRWPAGARIFTLNGRCGPGAKMSPAQVPALPGPLPSLLQALVSAVTHCWARRVAPCAAAFHAAVASRRTQDPFSWDFCRVQERRKEAPWPGVKAARPGRARVAHGAACSDGRVAKQGHWGPSLVIRCPPMASPGGIVRLADGVGGCWGSPAMGVGAAALE